MGLAPINEVNHLTLRFELTGIFWHISFETSLLCSESTIVPSLLDTLSFFFLRVWLRFMGPLIPEWTKFKILNDLRSIENCCFIWIILVRQVFSPFYQIPFQYSIKYFLNILIHRIIFKYRNLLSILSEYSSYSTKSR